MRRSDVSPDLDRICCRLLGATWPGSLPLGKLIGIVDVADVYSTFSKARPADDSDDFACGDWGPGRYAWLCKKPRLFAKAIPCVGRQGFFNVDAGQVLDDSIFDDRGDL